MDSLSYRKSRSSQPQDEPQNTAAEPLMFEPAPEVQAAPVRRESPVKHATPHRGLKKTPPSTWKYIAAAVASVVLIGGLLWALGMGRSGLPDVDESKYQAVFLSNGQVYFGKLSQANAGYVKITNVFYLQRKASTTDNKENPQNAAPQTANDVELVKLGNEIHGPTDTMIVAREQVLFYENLKDTGNVMKTISQYKAQNK